MRFQAGILRGTFLLLLSGVFVQCAAKDEDRGVVVRVKDGDTFVAVINGVEETIRFIGIDAPESSYNEKARRDAKRSHRQAEEILVKGGEATAFLKQHLKPETIVRLEYDVRRQDRYGRLLCYVYLPDGTMVNELLVREGHAIAKRYPPNVKHQERLRAAGRELEN